MFDLMNPSMIFNLITIYFLQWCNPDRVSTWYWLYRVFVALFFIAGITAQMMNSNLGIKWFIYMTDQGISFLALHFLIEACLVTARWTWERFHPEYDPCKYSKAATSYTDLADARFPRQLEIHRFLGSFLFQNNSSCTIFEQHIYFLVKKVHLNALL